MAVYLPIKEITHQTQIIVSKFKIALKVYGSCIIGDDCMLYGDPSLVLITESIPETKKMLDNNFDGCFIGNYANTLLNYELSIL